MSSPYGDAETLRDPFADPLADEDTSDMEFVSVGGSTLNFEADLHRPFDEEERASYGGGAGGAGGSAALDPAAMLGLSPAALQAVARQRSSNESRYLKAQKKGVWERSMHNVGVTYLSGLVLGGTIGFFRGFATAPSRRPRILLNSILNSCGKGGSALGNTIGTLGTWLMPSV